MRECQEAIDSREFAEWLAYDRIEPFGMDRIDHGFAMIAAMLHNAHRKKNTKAKDASDFMPRWDRAYTRKSPEELRAVWTAFVAEHNARQKKGRK